ncbi:MAG: hypothetical protein JWR81_1101 [Pseudonocardia sp.]|nr:hypothetical protein [Pseudonocardia sp.]
MTLPALPRSAPVRSQPPPLWLMYRVVNPTARRIVASPLGRWTGPVLLLRFTGRRTGRRLEIPVIGHHLGESLHVFTDAAWALNFEGGRTVTVIGRGQQRAAHGRLVDDPAETAAAMRRVLGQVPSPRRLGLHIDPGHRPSDNELAAVRRTISLSVP